MWTVSLVKLLMLTTLGNQTLALVLTGCTQLSTPLLLMPVLLIPLPAVLSMPIMWLFTTTLLIIILPTTQLLTTILLVVLPLLVDRCPSLVESKLCCHYSLLSYLM